MPPGINLTVTSDPKDMIRAIVRMEKEIDKLKGKLRDTGRAAKGAKRQTTNAFGGRALSDIKSYATALTGVGGVLAAFRLISAEIARVITLQDKASGAQVTLSSARQTLLRNLVGVPEAGKRGALVSAASIARGTGISEIVANQALAATVSATGQDLPLSKASVRLAAQFLADQPEAVAEFAGSLADVARVTKTKDPLVNLGFLTKVGALSRITDPSLQAANIPTALVGTTQFGATPQEAAALFAALSGAGVDPTGRRTGTGAIALSQQLDEFFTKEDKGILSEKRRARFTGELTLGQRLEFLQGRPKVGERFLEFASFEKKVLGPIESLVRGTPGAEGVKSISEQFRENLTQIPGFTQLAQLGRESIEARSIDPLERQARLQRLGAVTTGGLLTENLAAGRGGVARQTFSDILEALGTTAVGAKLRGAFFEAETRLGTRGAERGLQRGLETEVARLGATTAPGAPTFVKGLLPGPGAVFAGPPVPREPTQAELKQVELLEGILAELRRNREQDITEALQGNRFIPPEVTAIVAAATFAGGDRDRE